MSGRPSICRRESGQATVEFAIVLPLIVMLLMVVAQVVAVAYLQLAVTHLSREVARELVVNPDADLGRLAAQHSLLGQDGLRIETQIVSAGPDGGATIVVRVTHDVVAISGVFHRFLADMALSAESRMVME